MLVIAYFFVGCFHGLALVTFCHWLAYRWVLMLRGHRR